MILRRLTIYVGIFVIVGVFTILYFTAAPSGPVKWTPGELSLIKSLSLSSLPPPPPAPGNHVADNSKAAEFGKLLFSDNRLSINGKFSCASCHQPNRNFTDGLDKAAALGHSKRNTPSLSGAVYSPWFYWDGRKDSLWSQALSPLEDSEEQGGNRMFYVHLLAETSELKHQYESIFGSLPDFSDSSSFPDNAAPGGNVEWNSNWAHMNQEDKNLVNQVFSNLGKVFAAYVRTLLPERTLFDTYADQLEISTVPAKQLISAEAEQGLRLFIGKARCTECHNGPLFTNHEFHNTGLLSYPGELPDRGRLDATSQLEGDPFNCLGVYSDANQDQCTELRYMRTGIKLLGAFRTPSLRNLAKTDPYMHKGQLKTLEEVLEHYNQAPDAMIGHNEATPLNLDRKEIRQLGAFLETLMQPAPVE